DAGDGPEAPERRMKLAAPGSVMKQIDGHIFPLAATRRGASLLFWFPVFRQRPKEQLFQVLVVTLQAAEQDVMIVGQGKERPRDPAVWHGHAQFASTIVLDQAYTFKAQLLKEGARVALNL